MTQMLKKIPLPITGVALGLAALGNLIGDYSQNIRMICGGIAFIFLLLYIVKILLYRDIFAEEIKKPEIAGVAATIPMAIMLLSTYIVQYFYSGAKILWLMGIGLHICIIIVFSYKFLWKLDIKKVYASYFIVYVGIVVASVTAPQYGEQALGKILWMTGCVLWILISVLVTYRYIKFRDIAQGLKPLFCIYAAPAGLCLAGYIQSFQVKSTMVIVALAIIAFVLYIVTVCGIPKYIKNGFYPSFAAFTFPFVIQAIGMKMTYKYFSSLGYSYPLLKVIVMLETAIACVLVVYTVIKYIRFISK